MDQLSNNIHQLLSSSPSPSHSSSFEPLNLPPTTHRPSHLLATSASHRATTLRPANYLQPPQRSHVQRATALATTNMPGLVSATGVLAFLAEEEPELKVFALQTLNDDIDTVWTEVAGALSQM